MNVSGLTGSLHRMSTGRMVGGSPSAPPFTVFEVKNVVSPAPIVKGLGVNLRSGDPGSPDHSPGGSAFKITRSRNPPWIEFRSSIVSDMLRDFCDDIIWVETIGFRLICLTVSFPPRGSDTRLGWSLSSHVLT